MGDRLYVIADDELHLGCFDAAGSADGTLVRLFAGELPRGRKARKARKPDLEVITRLPPGPRHPYGALLAMGSGSRPGRCVAKVVSLDDGEGLAGTPRPVEFSALYAALARRFPDPNIEGGAVSGDELFLLQRANRDHPVGGMIRIPLADVWDAIATGAYAGRRIAAGEVDLPRVGATPLSFTDCAALEDGRLVFTAVAEDTGSSYDDGGCAAAAVGMLDDSGRVLRLHRLDPVHKVEGVHASLVGGAIRLLLVTDADDVDVPALLLEAELP